MKLSSRYLSFGVLLLLGGCPERRKPIAMKNKDLGPSVVIIDKRTPPPDPNKTLAPTLPLDDEKEPDDSSKSAQPVTPGRGIKGELGAPPVDKKQRADEDWYSFMVPATGEGDVILTVATRAPDPARAAPTFSICVEDCKAPPLVSGGKPGEALVMPNYAARVGQTVYVRLVPQAIAKPSKAVPAPVIPTALAYELTIVATAAQDRSEREPNDSKEAAGPIDEGVDWEGHYSRVKDEDYYQVKGGAADSTLRIELSAVPGVQPGVLFVPGDVAGTVSIKGIKGEELRIRNLPLSKGLDSLLGIRNLDGRNEAQAYVVRLSTEAPIEGAEREPNDKPEEAHRLALPDVGQSISVSGYLWANDQDTYRIEGPDDASYKLELTMPHKADLRLERVGPTGTVVTKVDGGGAGKPEVMEKELVATTKLVRVRGRSKDVLFDEPYVLKLTRVE